jgi:hypothetical protein
MFVENMLKKKKPKVGVLTMIIGVCNSNDSKKTL